MKLVTGLPIVNPEVGYSISKDMRGQKDDDFLEKYFSHLDEVNPAISHWIRLFAQTTDNPEDSMFSGVMVYKLLESQAEANKLAEDFC